MKKLLALALLSCYSGFCDYTGYILFQTVPSKAGSSATPSFSLLIDGTFPAFATTANGGKVVNTASCGVNSIVCPADLIFTEDSTCLAPYPGWDVTAYSPVTGRLTVTVRLLTLSNTHPIKIYGCAGNAAVSSFQGGARGAAYDNEYLLAYHMEETSGTVLHDSTANADDATRRAAGQPNPWPAGLIGGGQKFAGYFNSGNNDYALFESPTQTTSQYTVEYWTNATSYIDQDCVFLESSSGSPSAFTGFYSFPVGFVTVTNTWNSAFSPSGPPGENVAPGSFHYIVLVRDGDTARLYVDGVAGPAKTGYGIQGERWKGLGWDGGAHPTIDSFNGVLDEVFYSDIARSSDYVTARFNNLSNPSAFYTVSDFTMAPILQRSTTQADSQVNLFVF